jgi:hypothetical protein
MPNNRIRYATKQVGFAPDTSTTWTAAKGVQQVDVNTSFELQQILQIGQDSVYDNIEGIPNVEVTISKVLDGRAPLYTLATRDASDPTLAGRSTAKCLLAIAIFDETKSSATGAPQSQVVMSGLFCSSMSWALDVDGPFTETITLVGNDQRWAPTYAGLTFTGQFDNTDTASSTSGNVNTREDFLYSTAIATTGANGIPSGTIEVSILPKNIPGVDTNGTLTSRAAHVQSINVSANLGRTNLLELGRRNAYFRTVDFPVEVTTEITIISVSGSHVSHTEDGIFGTAGICTQGTNLQNQVIRICTCEGTRMYLGTKNKLAGSTMGGGGTDGGNDTVTYTYTNQNDLNFLHMADPNTNLRPNTGANNGLYLAVSG